MSAAVIYAALLVIVMGLMSGCAKVNVQSKRERVVCRSSIKGQRAAPWSPPRDRL